MKEQIEMMMAPLLARYTEMCVVIGVLEGEQHTVSGQGSIKEQLVPDGRSMFEIESVTKVFTTTLLALMVHEGLVQLETPIRELLPEFPNLPEEMTLLRLATHTAGLPRLPDNLWWAMIINPNVYWGDIFLF